MRAFADKDTCKVAAFALIYARSFSMTMTEQHLPDTEIPEDGGCCKRSGRSVFCTL